MICSIRCSVSVEKAQRPNAILTVQNFGDNERTVAVAMKISVVKEIAASLLSNSLQFGLVCDNANTWGPCEAVGAEQNAACPYKTTSFPSFV